MMGARAQQALAKAPGNAPLRGAMQRKCACGAHTPGGGTCARCAGWKSSLQPKLSIGPSNDPLEHEADRVAERVLSMRDSGRAMRSPLAIQRFAPSAREHAREAPASVQRVLGTSGNMLDDATRQDMELRFGEEFGAVRVHEGSAAARSAEEVGASAYTVGNHVVFGGGRFSPGSAEGRRLLAHELVHVVQQQASPTSPRIQMRAEPDSQGDYPMRERVAAEDEGRDPEATDAEADSLEATDREPATEQAVKGETATKPKKSKKKPSRPKSPCTERILAEGTCQFLVDNSKWNCCDPDNGLKAKERTEDFEKKNCPSRKFTPIFTCDNKCKKALSKGCSDKDNWMALPKGSFSRSRCYEEWTICANGVSTKGYVRDRSSTKKSFEVSPGIQDALGVKGTFRGAVYPPGTAQSTIDADECCKK